MQYALSSYHAIISHIMHEVGRIVENAYPSLNINRFKADSLYGTLDYCLLKTIWDSSTLGEQTTQV